MKRLLFLLLLIVNGLVADVRSANAQISGDSLQVYPNPFENVANIHFQLAGTDTVTLNIFNATGVSVVTLFDHTLLPAGSYNIVYNGDSLPVGLYLLKLETGNSKVLLQRISKPGSTNSIHQAVFANETAFFPNPTSGYLQTNFEGLKKIVVTNPLGQIVQVTRTESTGFHLDSNLNSGEYIVSVFNESGRLLASKMIIRSK